MHGNTLSQIKHCASHSCRYDHMFVESIALRTGDAQEPDATDISSRARAHGLQCIQLGICR